MRTCWTGRADDEHGKDHETKGMQNAGVINPESRSPRQLMSMMEWNIRLLSTRRFPTVTMNVMMETSYHRRLINLQAWKARAFISCFITLTTC
jgi:hypothetical protein